jgi:hypothetical protein
MARTSTSVVATRNHLLYFPRENGHDFGADRIRFRNPNVLITLALRRLGLKRSERRFFDKVRVLWMLNLEVGGAISPKISVSHLENFCQTSEREQICEGYEVHDAYLLNISKYVSGNYII